MLCMFINEGGIVYKRDSMLRVLGVMSTPNAESTSDQNNQELKFSYILGRSLSRTGDAENNLSLYHQSVAWDEQNDRFVNVVEKERTSTCKNEILTSEDSLDGLNETAFHVIWRRAPPISPLMWTEDEFRDAEEVLDELHVVLPAIYFYCPNVCLEINNALYDNFCNSVLQ